MNWDKFILSVMVLFAFCACGSGKVTQYKVEVVAEYNHDVTSYTQGLFFHDGKLYESTGQYGESTLRIVDLPTGEALQRVNFSKKYFVEGSVVLDGKLYVLTWTNKVVFIYDPDTLEYQSTYSFPREGWGLTTDGKNLIVSDGSADLFFLTPQFSFQKRLTVKMDGRPIRYLNELEYIDGKIWANVYTSNLILIINPSSGEVEATIDATGLLPNNLRTDKTDVLNGIAYNSKDGKIYLTGKNWPKLYEIKLVKIK